MDNQTKLGQKLLVVDGNSILNRAFFGVRPLTTKDGQFTNAIYGFLATLNRVVAQEQPDSVAVAFDMRKPTFRHQMFDGYKAGRKGMPPELASQLQPTKDILEHLGFHVLTCPGFEADDLLGTLAKGAKNAGWSCVLCTGDRDSLQLVGGGVTVQLASTKGGNAVVTVFDAEQVQAEYGIPVSAMIDLKSLMGDSSDNIPGAAGIGQKTAVAMLQSYGTLEGVYENLDKLTKGQREKLENSRDMVLLSRKLAEICCDAPVDTSPAAYLLRPANVAACHDFFVRYELSTTEKRWSEFLSAHAENDLPAIPAAAVQSDVQVYRIVTEVDADFWTWGVCFCGDFDTSGAWKNCFFLRDGLLFQPKEDQVTDLLLRHGHLLRVWQGKPLYRRLLLLGAVPAALRPFAFDGELAAYLRSPAASSYDLCTIAAECGVTEGTLSEDFSSASLSPQMQREVLVLQGTLDALQAHLEQTEHLYSLLQTLEAPLSLVLARMEHEGFALDRDGLRAYGSILNRELLSITEEIFDMAGMRFNLNSPKQLGHVLFEVLGLPPSKKTKTGYSTNAQVLEELAPFHPVVQKLLRHRKLAKLTSTYVEGLLQQADENGRVHSTFLQTEARTGRISSTEPNLQNIPVRTPEGAKLREFFRPREGWLLIDADYSQIELRILAHMANDDAMLNAFRTGVDIHTLTASQVFGAAVEDVTKEMRFRAKAVNFGIVYGIGAFSLAKDIGVTVKEADAYIKGYLRTYPGVAAFMQSCIASGREKGYVETLLGRRRYVPELAVTNKVTRALGERIAMNSPIQGTAADVIKIAMVNVVKRLDKEGLRTRLILQVHDELLLESPRDEAEKAAVLLKEEMEHAMELQIPLTAEVKIAEKWEK